MGENQQDIGRRGHIDEGPMKQNSPKVRIVAMRGIREFLQSVVSDIISRQQILGN